MPAKFFIETKYFPAAPTTSTACPSFWAYFSPSIDLLRCISRCCMNRYSSHPFLLLTEPIQSIRILCAHFKRKDKIYFSLLKKTHFIAPHIVQFWRWALFVGVSFCFLFSIAPVWYLVDDANMYVKVSKFMNTLEQEDFVVRQAAFHTYGHHCCDFFD